MNLKMQHPISMKAKKEDVLSMTNDCSCTACSTGCSFGSGFFAPEQITSVADHLKITEERLKAQFLEPQKIFNTELFRPKFAKPFGKCTFFKENKCSINEVKPLQCKIAMNCKSYSHQLHDWFYSNYAKREDNELSMKEFEEYQEFQKNELHRQSN